MTEFAYSLAGTGQPPTVVGGQSEVKAAFKADHNGRNYEYKQTILFLAYFSFL